MGIPLRVLIVEDSVDDTELVLRQLRRAGYDPVSERVQTAEEMKTALEREAWDLVVSDYSMPQFDAPTALNLLNQSGHDVPFIVVSGSIGEDIAVAMMKTGAHDYILKQNLARFVPALQRELREAENRRQQRLAELARQRLEIERTELLERLTQENEDLTALTLVTTNAISTLDLDELLRVLLGRVMAVMHADTATILLTDGAELHVRASVGAVNFSDSTHVKHVGDCFAGTVASRRKPVYVEDAALDPLITDPLIRERGIRSMLGVPLKRNGTLVGVLHVDWLTVRPCRDREVHLLEITAEQCAAAIHNAQLYQEARRSAAELRLESAALNAAANSIVITDRNGTIEWVNPAFTALTYYRAEEAIGKNPRELSRSGLHDQRFYRDLWNTILAGHVWHGEVTNRRKDGSLYCEEQSITSVKDTHGELTHFVAIGRDLTEQKRLEAQLLQAQKMEVVGRLASGIAHDFNNLLTVINGTAELVLTDLKEGDTLRTDLQAIGKAGMRAASLTRQLLAFSRKQIMKPVALNLNSLLADLQDMVQRLIGEDVALMIVPAKDVGHVMADPGQIEQVVMNLAVNARDAMANGGMLTIETRNVDLDEAAAAAHPSLQPGPHVRLAISDTGGGMDEATRVQIFEPFFTTKELGKGTGLGLSTVYGILKQSGGSIGVSSELGRGTTFTIYLPLVADVAHNRPPAPTVTSVHGAETVLIVDDEEAVCRLTKRILQSAGYTVLTASNGGEALLLLDRHDGPVHLMVTDMVMPGVSGRELAAQLTDTRPRMKVLYMSGYTDDTVLRRGLLDKAAHFIGKPYTTAELTRTVREVLDS